MPNAEGLSLDIALDRLEDLITTVETEQLPVPVREVWIYGDAALGLDPVHRLNIYLTKDVLLGDEQTPVADERFQASHGVAGIGKTVRADWAETYPEFIKTNDAGHVAPERCLAAQLLNDDEPIHLEVCNSSFEDNVVQRLEGAIATENYREILDPRGVCLWIDDGSGGGERSDEALQKLRNAELPFPKLPEALSMLGIAENEAERAAAALQEYQTEQVGPTVRGDVI